MSAKHMSAATQIAVFNIATMKRELWSTVVVPHQMSRLFSTAQASNWGLNNGPLIRAITSAIDAVDGSSRT
jgi:hypothetical protein